MFAGLSETPQEDILQYILQEETTLSQVCLWEVILLTYLPAVLSLVTSWTFRNTQREKGLPFSELEKIFMVERTGKASYTL